MRRPAEADSRWADMDARLFVAAGAALGSGLMYLFDPGLGKTRRTLVHNFAGGWATQWR